MTENPPAASTLDEVAELAAADDLHRYELDNGTLLVTPPADAEHAALVTRFGVWLCTHGYPDDCVLATAGLRVTEQTTGRSPDVLVLRHPAPAGTVWIDPADVLLAVEIVSPGSEKLDRLVKPGEYARAGIPHFWRVERDSSPATVHRYTLGTGEHGEPTYVGHRATLLTDLLAGPAPASSR